jgi:hypothetical protein
MMRSKLDHLVVAAVDLEVGRAYIEKLLGVQTAPGGRHEAIGTHNRLLRLGDDQYLEIIAVDPDGMRPDGGRWFALDDPAMRTRLEASPALVTWVARTDDIDGAARLSPYTDTTVGDMKRGELSWRMTLARGGRLLQEGVLPLLIQWQTETMPPARLPDVGCSLERFVIQSPHAPEVERVLKDLGIGEVEVELAEHNMLSATISTPDRGEVVLRSV